MNTQPKASPPVARHLQLGDRAGVRFAAAVARDADQPLEWVAAGFAAGTLALTPQILRVGGEVGEAGLGRGVLAEAGR